MTKKSKKLIRANLDMVHVHENPDFGKLEVIVVDGQTYFPADDCAKMLGFSYTAGVIAAYCRATQRFLVPALGGNKQVDYISKDDLSRLIAESEILNARQFEKWVFGEVVRSVDNISVIATSPSVRKFDKQEEKAESLHLIKQENFGEVQCDFYRNERDEIFMTINQLAMALEYATKSGIENILMRNGYLNSKEFSTTHGLWVVEGNRTVRREMRVFTEDGVYEVTMLSNQPKARDFRSWIRSVLKDIRKHGMYATEELLDNPEFASKVFMRLHEERQQRIALEVKVEQDKPLVEFANIVGNTSKLITMSEMAKMLCSKHLPIGRNRLYERLRNKGILMQNNEPYQRYVDSGHFVVRDVIKGDLVYPQTMITGKGQKFIVDCLRQEIDEARVLSSGEEQPEAVAVKN